MMISHDTNEKQFARCKNTRIQVMKTHTTKHSWNNNAKAHGDEMYQRDDADGNDDMTICVHFWTLMS